ncbi:MAG: PKD domain-containing protein [Methanomicrobiales archaeon]|nr:PKD domain-containing protein [Methanomicrobiales archaeon]
MGPGHDIRRIQVLVVIIIGCSLMAGTVSAGPYDQFLAGAKGCSFDSGSDSAFRSFLPYYPDSLAGYGYGLCCDSDPCVCAFGGTCGGRETVISLGMTGSRFSGTPTTGPAPLTVKFSYNSGPETGSGSWDFGDGTYGSGMEPVHTYTTPGTYTVKLTVRQGGADLNYRTSSSMSWGQESTWLKEGMIQVTGPLSTGDLVTAGQEGTLTPATGLVQAGTVVQPGPVIRYLPVPVRYVQPLYVQAGPAFIQAPANTTWKTGFIGYC